MVSHFINLTAARDFGIIQVLWGSEILTTRLWQLEALFVGRLTIRKIAHGYGHGRIRASIKCQLRLHVFVSECDRNKVPFREHLGFAQPRHQLGPVGSVGSLWPCILQVAGSGTKKAPLLRLAGALQTTYLFLHTMRA